MNLVWLIDRNGDVSHGAEGGAALDTIFRISSMTKPVTAVAALLLVEDGVLSRDQSVEPFLPELAGRRVLRNPAGPLDDTVPAVRSITVDDVLTFRLGWGMDFEATGPQPVLEAMADLGLGAGPPAPASPPEPDEWMRRIATLPLQYQPGERWLYHTGAEVLGVLVARAARQPLEVFLRERIFDPLGMTDTGFHVPASKLARFGPVYGPDFVYDPPDGQWSAPPAFPNGGDGLVSTVADYHAFARALRDGDLLPRAVVAEMTRDHTGTGWGLGVGVKPTGAYGWDGGLGSTWANDPAHGLVGLLLSDHMWTSPEPPAVVDAFWARVYS